MSSESMRADHPLSADLNRRVPVNRNVVGAVAGHGKRRWLIVSGMVVANRLGICAVAMPPSTGYTEATAAALFAVSLESGGLFRSNAPVTNAVTRRRDHRSDHPRAPQTADPSRRRAGGSGIRDRT